MNKKQIATTTEEWLQLPRFKRAPRKWYWPTGWYEAPFAMIINDWGNWEKHIQKEYPIQHWLRENFQYLLRHLYHTVKGLKHYIINPRRRMRNAIFPAKYVDLVELVPQFHFQAIIEYIEVEKAFEEFVWDENLVSSKTAEVGKELKKYYNYIKVDRPLLLKDLHKAYEKVEETNFTDQERFNEVDKLDMLIKTKDTELCVWVIHNRDFLWT